ncbi:hypothetical protein E4T89_04090 [Jeotgalicoccus nanhaiensis]|jgi:hypothetical protein|uniref:Type II toxin-antitoxin system Phd/YefM family antitoxin n=1 Tax=Jeotgalicoccus nanhaiensis TaxID=568603 RepID=A0ABR9XXY4_9STAP|nr:hypothetical protein [Jeotgalicoccus nanhaiensis]MBF0753443.1 hypothetical protein [Jeotgalicoccus nanhaiensis]TFU62603.1 hypothetical protein E4T89_04090 [Jeotgalicoccus nanhaiensis]
MKLIKKEALYVGNGERMTIDLAEFQKNPENAFKTAEKEQSVVHVIDGDKTAGVLMSKAQYEFARDEIESLYDVIDALTVNESLANSDEKTFSIDDAAYEKIKELQLDEERE